MSNDINLSFRHLLSTDITDLDAGQTATKKAQIIAEETAKGVPVTKFNDNYWNNQPWHFKSLKTLLGDSSSTWYLNKIKDFDKFPEPNELPLITISSSFEELTRSSIGTTFRGIATLKIITDSAKDRTKLDQLLKRVIYFIATNKIDSSHFSSNNGISALKPMLTGVEFRESDVCTLKYSVTTRMIGI